MMSGYWILPMIVIAASCCLQAQERLPSDDIRQLIHHVSKKEMVSLKNEGPASSVDFHSSSELKMVFSGLIWIYQQTLSSQDMAVCNFSPSCSRFGSQALHDAGMLKGLCLTSDRLQRCHGLPGQHRHYVVSSDRMHFLDPVASYITP